MDFFDDLDNDTDTVKPEAEKANEEWRNSPEGLAAQREQERIEEARERAHNYGEWEADHES